MRELTKSFSDQHSRTGARVLTFEVVHVLEHQKNVPLHIPENRTLAPFLNGTLDYVHTHTAWAPSTKSKHIHTGNRCLLQCSNTRSRPCIRIRTPYPNSGVHTFILVPSDNRTRAPCSGTKGEHRLALVIHLLQTKSGGNNASSSSMHGGEVNVN